MPCFLSFHCFLPLLFQNTEDLGHLFIHIKSTALKRIDVLFFHFEQVWNSKLQVWNSRESTQFTSKRPAKTSYFPYSQGPTKYERVSYAVW